MTYSIVARDAETGQLGGAIQSAVFGAGVGTLFVESGIGAVVSQSFSDSTYGPICLLALRAGASAADALAGAARRDRMSPYRQVGVVSASGTSAAFTGRACIAEAGHVRAAGVACQANMMASAEVWPAMLEAFRGATGALAERLMTALEAAQAAGGDWRGQEAGRVLVVGGEPTGVPASDVVCDVRVDNHPEAVAELRRLVSRNQVFRAVRDPGSGLSPEAAVETARAAGLEEPQQALAGLGAAAGAGDLDTARSYLDRLLACDARYLELVRRLPFLADALGLEPVLPRFTGWARPPTPRGAGRAGSRGPRSGPGRR